MSRRLWVITVLAATFAMSSLAHAEPRTSLADGAVGTVQFRTFTPTSQRALLTPSYLSEPSVVISGVLSLPKEPTLQREGKSPAVVLAHGSGGISDDREYAWARRMNSWGIAAFIVDSFTGRGIKPPLYSDSPKATHVAAHLVDVYLALQLLSTHPRIDGNRVALMGFSRGGETAVNAIFDPFRVGVLGVASLRFSAYVPFYPYCSFRHTSRFLASAPMLMLLGGADEMTGTVACEHLAAWLKERGIPVRVVVYPHAHHGFDHQGPVKFDKNFVGIVGCEAEYDLDTRTIRRLDTGAVLATKEANDAWVRECRHKGAHFGGDTRAREASIIEVRQFLLTVFGH